MNEILAQNYAKVLLHYGVNLQKGQPVFISAPVEAYEFVEILVREAYRHGASDVELNWGSGLCFAERMLHAQEKSLYYIRSSLIKKYEEIIAENRAVISLVACESPYFEKVLPERTASFQKVRNKAFSFYSKAIMNSDIQWLVAAVAVPVWAEMLYPSLPANKAIEHLWDEIFSVARITAEDPLAHWQIHLDKLHAMRRKLAALNLATLQYESSNGTHLAIGLPKNCVWQGGNEKSGRKVPFAANIPTEEIFTAPDYTLTEGTVVSTRPLVVFNQVIENIHLTFEKGRVTKFDASGGKEALAKLLENDTGAKYLGEVALVPKDSPISEKNYPFYTTLIDENASCHLALGAAYPNCVENGKLMSDEELQAAGLNQSDIHVDFMIGADDLGIIGITKDGKEIPVFTNGTWSEAMYD